MNSKTGARLEALENLYRYDLKIGDTLHVETNYVGNVGTAQSRVFIIRDGDLVNITALVAWASEYKPKERKSDGRWVIETRGVGYNRAQFIVNNLEYALKLGNGSFKISEF